MCIRTRITHWRATGLLPVILAYVAGLATLGLIEGGWGATARETAYLVAFSIVGGSVLYAAYLSPHARDVRQQIVRARRVDR